jgi:hypothetical protein
MDRVSCVGIHGINSTPAFTISFSMNKDSPPSHNKIKIGNWNRVDFEGINNLRSVLPPEYFDFNSFQQEETSPTNVLLSLNESHLSYHYSSTTLEIEGDLVRQLLNSSHHMDGAHVHVEGLNIRSSSGLVEGIIVDSSLYPKLVVQFPFGRLFTNASSCHFLNSIPSGASQPSLTAWESSGQGGWKTSELLYDLLTDSFTLMTSSQTRNMMIGNDQHSHHYAQSCSLRDQHSNLLRNKTFFITTQGCGYSQQCHSDENGNCKFRAHVSTLSLGDIWCFFPKEQDNPQHSSTSSSSEKSDQILLTQLHPQILWNYDVVRTPREQLKQGILFGYLTKEFGGYIDDMIIENFPHLQAILKQHSPQSHALGGLLKLGAQSIQQYHPSSAKDLASTIVQCADELCASPSMMTAVVNAQGNQCSNISEWGSSYLPNYVQHHKEALATEVGVTILHCPGGHDLTRSTGSDLELFCDGCGATKLQNHPYFFECRACDFDLCLRCSNPRFSPQLCPFHEHGHDPLAPPLPVPNLPTASLEEELTAAGVPYSSVVNWVSNVSCGGVSTPLKAVVRSYTGQWYYRDLNYLLRQHSGPLSDIPKYRAITDTLREAVSRIPCPYARHNLYRGQAVLGNQTYPVGAEVTWTAFTSTTINPQVAQNFSSGGYVFEIVGGVPEACCASVTSLSVYPSEEEVLLIPSLTFRVLSNHGSRITLEVAQDSLPLPSPSLAKASSSSHSQFQCQLCEFEECISNPRPRTGSVSSSEAMALRLLSQEKFLLNVLCSKGKFEASRIAFQWTNTGSQTKKTVVPPASRRPWLYAAARNDLPEVTSALMRLGCDPCATIDLGSTALHAASFYGNVSCVQNILRHCDGDELSCLLAMRNSASLGNKTALEEAKTAEIRAIIEAYRTVSK